jgi:CheY-like chemotaxis protein
MARSKPMAKTAVQLDATIDAALEMVIISDLRMPHMDGPALYLELSTRRPELAARMVFVTGDTLGADVTGFLSDSGAPVIEKPLDPGEVSRRVQTMLGGRTVART